MKPHCDCRYMRVNEIVRSSHNDFGCDFRNDLPMADRQFSKEWFQTQFARVGKGQADLFHFMNARFGLDRTKVNKMVNGRRKPQPNELPALMTWLGISLREAVEGTQDALADQARPRSGDAEIGDQSHFPQLGPRNVPVRQLVTGGDDGDFVFSDEVIDYARRPPSLDGQRVIVAYVTGESMIPKYEPGEPVYAYVGRPAIPGDHVIIEMHPKEDGGNRRGFIKKLIRRSGTSVICQQYNPDRQIEYLSREIKHIYKIVTNTELFN